MTELEAVNRMLEAIGSPPVLTVPESDDGSEEWQAKTILDAENEQVQARGWATNTVDSRTMTPNGSDQIDLTGILSFEAVGSFKGKRYASRGGLLYDVENDTNIFSGTVTLKVIDLLDFTDLPTNLAYLVAIRAAQRFQRSVKQSRIADAITQDELQGALRKAMREDDRLWANNRDINDDAVDAMKGRRRTPYP